MNSSLEWSWIKELNALGLLLTQLTQLTTHQSAQLHTFLGCSDDRPSVGRLLDVAAQLQLRCPRCHATRWYRHGREIGLQRYHYRTFNKTFYSPTGTPLARLQHNERWLVYLESFLASHTVRHAAIPAPHFA